MPSSPHTLRRQMAPPQRSVENANKAPNAGPITEDELNFILGQSWPQPPRLKGCNQNCVQGRQCTCAPKPAEACTEIGADLNATPDHEYRRSFWLGYAVFVALAGAAAALLVRYGN